MLPGLGVPRLERAEIYFLDAARGMVESGDWLVPRYQGEPFFDKPILSYWLMAAAMKAFGTTALAARCVPVLAALGLLLATAWLGTLLYDRRSALAGAFVLSTTLAFFAFARIAMADMLLALWTTLAVALGVLACRERPPSWALPALGAALGLGFATKGPIALLVPGLALAPLVWRRRRGPWAALPLASAALLCAVLGLGWFALVYARLGPAPLEYFFLRENLQRFAAETYDVGRPFWFYPPAYLAQGLPWAPLLPLALWRLLAGAVDPRGRPATRLLTVWVVLVLVPLSLSRGKIDYYLLPLYPALSLVLGRHLALVPWQRLDRAWARGVLLLAALGAALLLTWPPRLPEPWLPAPVPRLLLAVAVAAALLAFVLAAWRPTPARVAAALGGSAWAVYLLAAAFFLPAFAAAQPNRAIARDVGRERAFEPRARLVYCNDPSRARRDVLFEARHEAVEQCDLWAYAASREPWLLLVTPEQALSFRALPGWRRIARYPYLPAAALTFDGLRAGPRAGELVLGANFATADPEADRLRRREYRKGVQKDLAAEAARATPAP